MKMVFGILAAVLLAIVLLVYIASPKTPEVSGIPDYDAGVYCLREIARKYDPLFFTYKGWVKTWYGYHADKWGIDLNTSLLSYYKRYVQLQLDVDCYVQAANDPSLNMTLSPTEFKAVYNVIAENHALKKIQ